MSICRNPHDIIHAAICRRLSHIKRDTMLHLVVAFIYSSQIHVHVLKQLSLDTACLLCPTDRSLLLFFKHRHIANNSAYLYVI